MTVISIQKPETEGSKSKADLGCIVRILSQNRTNTYTTPVSVLLSVQVALEAMNVSYRVLVQRGGWWPRPQK